MNGTYEVSAISMHAFPSVESKYKMLSTGACFGDKYGPVVISSRALKSKQLLRVRIGIPGKLTTAFLALKLYEHHLAGDSKSGICYSEVPFDQIMDQLQSGKLDAGLIIHEGQLDYQEKGFHKIVDLGEWWHKETGLPLPLGGIAVRRDLPPEVQFQIGRLIQESIRYALAHKEEALSVAHPFARGLDLERTAKFVDMYVNEMTVEWGRVGLKAVKTILERGYAEGLVKSRVDMEDAIVDLRRHKTAEPVAAEAVLESSVPPPVPPLSEEITVQQDVPPTEENTTKIEP